MRCASKYSFAMVRPRRATVIGQPLRKTLRRHSTSIIRNRSANLRIEYGDPSVLRDGLGRAAGLCHGRDELRVIEDEARDVAEPPDAAFRSP